MMKAAFRAVPLFSYACYTIALWQCSPQPGIIITTIGRFLRGGAWLNPIL
jgi:hypothetical protein